MDHMNQAGAMFEHFRLIGSCVVTAIFWVYLFFTWLDIKNTQEILHDRLWTDEPGEDKATILKGMIEAQKHRAKMATIGAVWFSVLTVYFAFFS